MQSEDTKYTNLICRNAINYNQVIDLSVNSLQFGPSTFYLHEKKVPYPYYVPQAIPCCEISPNDHHRHMWMPHYIIPLTILGKFTGCPEITSKYFRRWF